MQYTWKDFDINEAVGGALVGVPTSINTTTEDIDDISSVAGKVTATNIYRGYKVVINGKTAYLDDYGKILAQVPENAFGGAAEMKIATTTIEETIGNDIDITRSGDDPGYDTTKATVSNMEPRDHFAIQILSAMLVHSNNPESFDDASIMMYSRAAYRWAQGMMNVAANTRHGKSESQSGGAVNVNEGDLQNNTERLLYNLTQYMKDGVAIKGSTLQGASPVQASVRGLENITSAYTIPEIEGNITISASIFNKKYICFEFQSYMAYSDVSVYLTLGVKEGETSTTRTVGYVIPKGSVVVLMPLDEAVTEITAINSKSVRGKGGNDPNTYAFT